MKTENQKLSSVSTEQAVLATVMSNEGSFDVISGAITAKDFSSPKHQMIFEAITNLAADNNPYELDAVYDWLGRNDKLGDHGVTEQYLMRLMQDIPASMFSLDFYAGLVRSKSDRRKAIDIHRQAIEQLENADDDTADVANEAMDKLTSVLTGSQDTSYKMIGDLMGELAEEMCTRQTDGNPFIRTGFNQLDNKMMMNNGDLVVLAARPSMGKAQSLTSKVRTPKGWTTIGELKVGDEISSVDNKPSFVTGVFDKGERLVYEIEFSDGRKTEACLEHLWEVSSRKWNEPRILDTQALIKLLEMPSYKGRLYIRTAAVESTANPELKIKPWLLGALIGDGHFTKSSLGFSSGDSFVIDKVIQHLPDGDSLKQTSKYDWRVLGNGKRSKTFEALDSYGLTSMHSCNKFIPKEYLNSSLADRCELIRGLMDTDGNVEKTGSADFTTTSEQLANDFAELVRSVGGICYIKSRITDYTYRGEKKQGKRSYTCSLLHSDIGKFITLPRRKVRIDARQGKRVNRLTIVSIKPVRKCLTRCISVSHDTHLYITDDYIVTHNTALAVNILMGIAKKYEGTGVFFSLEMRDLQVMERIAASECDISLSKIRSGEANEDEWARYQSFVGNNSDLSLAIVEKPQMTVGQIRIELNRISRERRHIANGKISVIAIDYLQIMGDIDEDKVNKIGIVTRTLKALGKEYDCPVILLSQLSRGVEQRTNKRPVSSDLRDSGTIEQDADIVAMIYRDDYYKSKEVDDQGRIKQQPDGLAEVILTKNRNGATGSVVMGFEGHYSRFVESMPEVIINDDDYFIPGNYSGDN